MMPTTTPRRMTPGANAAMCLKLSTMLCPDYDALCASCLVSSTGEEAPDDSWNHEVCWQVADHKPDKCGW